ncbi:MAG: hypothetical protein MI919_26105 [Holophagales bacterium]|nr:hypothetical protein [Holophagales bacterium]
MSSSRRIEAKLPQTVLELSWSSSRRPADRGRSSRGSTLAKGCLGLFSRDIFDILNPLEPRSSTSGSYNPEQPTDPSPIYGDLLSRKHPSQEVILVFDANFGGPKSLMGWQATDLSRVGLSYAELLAFRPELTMVGGFTWPRLLGLPQSVRNDAKDMACAYFVNPSPLCP